MSPVNETPEACPRDGQSLAWHRETSIGSNGWPRTTGEFIGCDFGAPAPVQANETPEGRVVCDCAPDCGERIACTETGVGHLGCGWCPDHQQARHVCYCDSRAPAPVQPPAPDPAFCTTHPAVGREFCGCPDTSSDLTRPGDMSKIGAEPDMSPAPDPDETPSTHRTGEGWDAEDA